MTDMADIMALIRELASLPHETEWAELKVNQDLPEEIGEYLSALSNSAALHGKERAYIVWGVEDETHRLVGTRFRPHRKKIGNEQLEHWVARQLHPPIHYVIHETDWEAKHFVLIEVPAASHTPVRFRDFEYIRVGSIKKKLRDHPEKERALWQLFERTSFETGVAAAGVPSDAVLSLIDYPEYFHLMKHPLPENRAAILERLEKEQIVHRGAEDQYDVTNLGAILFARKLEDFGRLARKALRVVIYRGENRIETIKEQPGTKGYAVGFEGAVGYINDQLPQNEELGQAVLREVRRYPRIAVRELVANALIHQDLNVTGAGPMVEIFTDRMEVSNPGVALIDPLRFLDEPPRSRNETLAALMRRMGICEERGTGIDKAIFYVEAHQLPAPEFRVTGASTIAILYGPREFSQMDRQERIRACYQHACLQYVSGKRMSNASLRKRLGIDDKSYPMASRIIRDTIREGLIKPYGAGSSKKDASYVPFWA